MYTIWAKVDWNQAREEEDVCVIQCKCSVALFGIIAVV